MKQILSLMRQDLATAFHDNIIIYMIIAPLLLALMVSAFLPSVESAGLTIAVSDQVDRSIVTGLADYGEIELFDTNEKVRNRVEMIDSVPGIISVGGEPVLLFEGNEPEGIINSSHAVLSAVLAGERLIRFEQRNLGEASSILREIIVLSLLMLALLLGGVVSGFNIIDEKDSKAVNALAVTPLSLQRYITARSLLALAIALITTTGTAFILSGTDINYLLLTVAIVASVFLIATFCLVIGGFSNNQISAIAVIKVLMPLYMAIPIVSLFVSNQWQLMFYPFPNYWQFQMLRWLISGGHDAVSFWQAASLTVLLSVVFLFLFIRVISSRLMPRRR